MTLTNHIVYYIFIVIDTCMYSSHMNGLASFQVLPSKSTPLSTVEDADDFNEVSYDDCHDCGIEDDMKQLCDSLLNLLECAAREPKQKKIVPAAEVNPQVEGVILRDRMSLVEKCFVFYNRLLEIKYAGNCIVMHLAMHCI